MVFFEPAPYPSAMAATGVKNTFLYQRAYLGPRPPLLDLTQKEREWERKDSQFLEYDRMIYVDVDPNKLIKYQYDPEINHITSLRICCRIQNLRIRNIVRLD